MLRIMFVCYGNICRSPMAEFLMKDKVDGLGRGKDFLIRSSATSYEEIGNPVHYGTRKVLDKLGISYAGKRAEKLVSGDYGKYDYFLCMDDMNVKDAIRIFGGDKEGKVKRLLDFSDYPREVADPWYTGDFETTLSDIREGIDAFYDKICAEK